MKSSSSSAHNLGIIDIKRRKDSLPTTIDDVSIETLQYWHRYSPDQRKALQQILLNTHTVIPWAYVLAYDAKGNVPFQISDHLMLWKFPWGKHDQSTLYEILIDVAANTTTEQRRALKEVLKHNKPKQILQALLQEQSNIDPYIITHTPNNLLQQRASIVSTSKPRDIPQLIELGKHKDAKPFMAARLDIDNKAIKDFISKKQWTSDNSITLLDELEQPQVHKPKQRDTYNKLFDSPNETVPDTATREYQEETWYQLTPSKLTPTSIIYETKLTGQWNPYLKQRTLLEHSWLLWNPWKIKYSASEKQQKLYLETNKNIQELYETLSSLTSQKLQGPSRWKRVLWQEGPYNRKLSSALLTFVLLKFLVQHKH